MTHKNRSISKKQRTRGIALITALLLLSLFTILTLSMVIATTSDTLIDGYYRNARGSFYAADSGVNAARQYLMSQIYSAIPTTYVPTSGSPTLNPSAATILSNLDGGSGVFSSYQSILGSQTASWPGSFKVDPTNTTLTMSCTPSPGCSTPGTSSTGVTSYVYTYAYLITVIGQSSSAEQNTIRETGNLIETVLLNPTSSTTTNFANYGTFFDQYAICSSAFVSGTMSGPFFSNGSWNFGDAGIVGSAKYLFTGSVGAVSSKVGYMYSSGTCDQSTSTSDSHAGTTINPTFQGGLSLGQNAIPLPTDAFSQEFAVLNGSGLCAGTCVTPTPAQMSVLTTAAGTSWPATGAQPTTGVYLPYSKTAVPGCSTPPCFTGGGIMVQGNANQVTMAAVTASGHSQQVFTIVQGTTTTTVTLDLTAGTTLISDNKGNSSGAITGLPENVSTGTATEGAMVYVNGNICSNSCSTGSSGASSTGLSGPATGAAIQNGSAVTVTATGTIAITGNITYATEPVTLNTADTLVPGVTNVLGIFTPTGDIQLQPTSSNQNMEIDASLAMISGGGSGGLVAQWNQINTLTIVGGRIASQAKSGASLNTRNIWFDQRYATGGFAPPWFPSTTVTTTTTNTAQVLPPVPNRNSWVNSSAQ